jgi:hypothetical protein
LLRQDHQKRSKLQERRAAASYGGSTTPGSGSGWIRKADVRTDHFLIECKTTTKESYSLKFADLDKLCKQALTDDKVPVFEIEYAGHKKRFVVLDEEDFLPVKWAIEEK